MGLTVTHVYGVPWLGGCIPGPIPDYSTEWDAMRLVVERMVALGWTVMSVADSGKFGVTLRRSTAPWFRHAQGDTLPHAVALAALAALKAVEANHG